MALFDHVKQRCKVECHYLEPFWGLNFAIRGSPRYPALGGLPYNNDGGARRKFCKKPLISISGRGPN